VTGVLDGLRVLDLSTGIAGPITGMMLADHGADVIKVEPPGGDHTRGLSGSRTWHRGKRSTILDLKRDGDRSCLLALMERSDVLLESFAPDTTRRLGIDFDVAHALNPRLVYTSITAYGRGNRHSNRPGYDALVSARTGLQWEQRGWPGSNVYRLAGRDGPLPDLAVPPECVEGASRDGPLFSYSTWPSLGAAFLATVAVSAALLARETTGRGQWVETSLLQGALAATVMSWQRVEHPDAPGFWTWVFDGRSPKGFFRCADGRWVQNWVQRPAFVVAAAGGDELRIPDGFVASRHDPDRLGVGPEDLVALHHYRSLMADAFHRFPSDTWVALAARADVPLQPVRSPEEALQDPDLLADGCTTEIQDPELGPIRQVGIVYTLDRCPAEIRGPAPRPGQHDDEIAALALAPVAHPDGAPPPRHVGAAAPLDGVIVLDLGFAVAGPFGTQVLSDLGADVVKINSLTDGHWHANHVSFSCSRGKRSLALNLKDPRGTAILHDLVARADVVHHNMRAEPARRLGIDYESLRAVNPRLVYCHTRGFDRAGARASSPANDQTCAALAGVEWEDGAVLSGGRPMWSLTSFGDTGNGFLSAVAVIQALYHRRRTGEGQRIDTSILGACLVNTSYAYAGADGVTAPRLRLDADQLGLSALYRLYHTQDGWICLAALRVEHWEALCKALGRVDLVHDPRFDTAASRAAHDSDLATELEDVFTDRTAAAWFELLDSFGVPCEVSSPTFALEVFDDPQMKAQQWVTSYRHPTVGALDQFGLLFDFSETPGRIAGPPLVVGDCTEQILDELGYDEAAIATLVRDGVVATAPT
jgi:crotonobetainyl-CoA:carnitine CoA-transferase CaiB-like acyl-CoA transferase